METAFYFATLPCKVPHHEHSKSIVICRSGHSTANIVQVNTASMIANTIMASDESEMPKGAEKLPHEVKVAL